MASDAHPGDDPPFGHAAELEPIIAARDKAPAERGKEGRSHGCSADFAGDGSRALFPTRSEFAIARFRCACPAFHPSRSSMRRVLTAALALFALSSAVEAQGLREKISQLFIFGDGEDPLFLSGSADPNNPADIRAHGSHFVPSAVSANGSLISFITNAISANIANAPIGSTSGGASFRFEAGVPVRVEASAGPIFAERGQTIGRGRTVIGVGRTSSHLSSLRGVDLNNIELFFTHENVDFAGCDSIYHASCKLMGVPNLENDVMQFKLALDLNVAVTSIYATYGLTDRLDVGFVLPLVSTSLHGQSDANIFPFGGTTAAHFFAGTPSNPVLNATRSVDGSAFGLGDVAVRTKFSVHQSEKTNIALLADARFATGDDSELLGSGQFSARGLAIVSARFGPMAAHVNSGYAFRGGRQQNDAVLATAGFDQLISHHVTLAADVVSAMQVGRSKLHLPPPVVYDVPFKRTVNPTTIPDIADDVVNGSFGFKFVTDNGFTIITNALVPLNRGGLRANLTYTTGVEFAF